MNMALVRFDTVEVEITTPRRVVILGSTGSIGCSTLDYIRSHKDRFEIVALVAGENSQLLSKQAVEFQPKIVLSNANIEQLRSEIIEMRSSDYMPYLGYADEEMAELVTESDVDIVIAAIVGTAGLPAVVNALRAGKYVGLANKESVVCGASFLRDLPGTIIPVDSEHSAAYELLTPSHVRSSLTQLILTASGGPFFGKTSEQLRTMRVEDALKHPVWSMGAKISIDSATLFNKALEIIEAYYLFGFDIQQLEAVIHPQSIFHALVRLSDGGIVASLAKPDMKLAISRALEYPHYSSNTGVPELDFETLSTCKFFPVDHSTFPALRLAKEALQAGGISPIVLNVANEVAVEKFVIGEFQLPDIFSFVDKALQSVTQSPLAQLEDLLLFMNELRTKLSNSSL